MIGFVDRDGTGQKESAGTVGAEMDFGDIAEAMGISKQRVQQLYAKGMRKLANADWSVAREILAGRSDGRQYASRSRRSRRGGAGHGLEVSIKVAD